MSALVCRSCLAFNIKINHIKNTPLQDIYEKLTISKLVNDNGWPETFCNSCYEQLQRCHKFSILSQDSENILLQFYVDGTELTPANVAAHAGKTNPEFSSSIKCEPVEEVLQEVTVKQEEIEIDSDGLIIDVKIEGIDELNDEDTINLSSDKDSDDDCIAISSEKIESEIRNRESEIKKSEPVIKKSEPVIKKSEPVIKKSESVFKKSESVINPQNTEGNKEKSLEKQSFNCNFCNKTYSIKRSLQKHVASKHVNPKSDCKTVKTVTTYTCTTCNKSFVKNISYRRHLKTHMEKQFDCKKCDTTFVDKKIFEAHKKSHAPEKSRACDLCGKGFIKAYLLKRHLRTHLGTKSYECDVCGKKCADRDSIRIHLRTHSGQKPYSCKECNANFVHIGNLRRHSMTHHKIGKRNYYCESCQKPFYDNSLYTRHMRIHTGEKPFVCNDCGKAYSDKDNYKRHRRLHTGEKPYACKLCDYRTSWANSMKYHFIKAHSKK